MNFDLTFYGQIVFVFALAVGILSFILGKKKTTNPILCGIIGFLTAFMPPLGVIFLAVLLFKNDKRVS